MCLPPIRVLQVRHGAGAALRAVLTKHGAVAGMLAGSSAAESATNNQAWLGDIASRLLCVFALDRFGDFASDQAVAPVTYCSDVGFLLIHFLLTRCARRVHKH